MKPFLPSYDFVVFGATPGGIVTAVRSTREGLTGVLVHHHAHVGGMMSNGLGVFDTLYDGSRCPLYDEIRRRIASHYPEGTHGYEPRVAEAVFESLIAGERNLTLVRSHYPVAVERYKRDGRRVERVAFAPMGGTAGAPFTLASRAFVDASYEGDLARLAGAAMTVGREGREVYGEPHAGRIFTRTLPRPAPSRAAASGGLRHFPLASGPLLPGSTGEGDRAVQAFNFRVCLTRDPARQRPFEKPPVEERELFFHLRDRWRFTNRLPNSKTSWNAPLLVGRNHDYPEGNWAERGAIARRHRDFALGLLWFLQHDAAVPAEIRAEAAAWGLPDDEFADNGGFPWEMYVREARRLVGRYVFTEHDAREGRAHGDAIAFTEWPLDSHACHLDTVAGSDHEGKMLLAEETRPAQVPWRCLLPRELDNLLVTVCLSASHAGWGTVRLEPVWMHIGESAALALALAQREEVAPACLPEAALRAELAGKGIRTRI